MQFQEGTSFPQSCTHPLSLWPLAALGCPCAQRVFARACACKTMPLPVTEKYRLLHCK